VDEAISKIQEKVSLQDREESGRTMRGTGDSILRNGTSKKEMEKGTIYTVLDPPACRKDRGHRDEILDLCFCSVAQGEFGLVCNN
jgi:hypothetical protein